MIRQYIPPAAGAILGLSSVYVMEKINACDSHDETKPAIDEGSEEPKPAHRKGKNNPNRYKTAPHTSHSRLEIAEIIKNAFDPYDTTSLTSIEIIALSNSSIVDEEAKQVYDNAVHHAEQTIGKDLVARVQAAYVQHPLIGETLEAVQDIKCTQPYTLFWREETGHEKSLAYTSEGYIVYNLILEPTRAEPRTELTFYEFNNDGLVDVVKLETEGIETYLPINIYGAMFWVADWYEKEFPSLLTSLRSNADTDCVQCVENAWSDDYALSIAIQLGVEGRIKRLIEGYSSENNCDQAVADSSVSVFRQEINEEGNKVVVYSDFPNL